jgi:hypothetical protein
MFVSALAAMTKSTTQMNFYTVRVSGVIGTSVQTNLAVFGN